MGPILFFLINISSTVEGCYITYNSFPKVPPTFIFEVGGRLVGRRDFSIKLKQNLHSFSINLKMNQGGICELYCPDDRRRETIENYMDFITDLDKGDKGKQYRKRLKNILLKLPTFKFKCEEDEYRAIGKFGRTGTLFDGTKMSKAFNEEEMVIIREIAHGVGAFDY